MSPLPERSETHKGLRLLWIKAGPLLPANTGGRLRTLAMLRAMSATGHRIHYLGLRSLKAPIDPLEESDPYATVKEWVDWDEAPKRSPRLLAQLLGNALFSKSPYVLDKYRSSNWRKQIAERASKVDLVICDFLTPAPNFRALVLPCPVILFQHNIESQIWKRLADHCVNPLKKVYLSSQFRRMWRAEKSLSANFDGVITVSPEDSAYCREQYGLTNVLGEVPTGVDVGSFHPPTHPPISPTIGFLGSMDWMPNIEGVLWFVREVLPKIRGTVPEARLKVIGRNPAPAIVDLARTDPLIEVTGTVSEVQPHVHDCSLIAVPLLAGGGTRIKIFECMAMGVPVVSTTIGAEGLPLVDGQDILLADSPEAFAAQILTLLTQPATAANQVEEARRRMETEFSWAVSAARFIELCSRTVNR